MIFDIIQAACGYYFYRIIFACGRFFLLQVQRRDGHGMITCNHSGIIIKYRRICDPNYKRMLYGRVRGGYV